MSNVEGFKDALSKIIDLVDDVTLLTLHIVSHGNEDAIGTSLDDCITWRELFHYTRQMNIKMNNTLMLVLSSCCGGGILSFIEPTMRAPYMAFVANTRPVTFADAMRGFPEFYNNYNNALDFPKALKALNACIDTSQIGVDGRQKTEFFVFTASSSFDEIFNPDRDPEHFKEVVNKLMPSTDSIPQELRVDKAKKIFREHGEKLRPYFTFQDILNS